MFAPPLPLRLVSLLPAGDSGRYSVSSETSNIPDLWPEPPGPVSRWEPYLELALKAAREAGVIQRHYYGTIEEVTHKGEVNLLTHVDLASEKLIKEIIRAEFPDHDILAEESDLETGKDPEFRWVIDPLDGTTNYAHSYPFFAVSIGVLYQGVPVAGVVYNPLLQEEFTAVRGGGAFLNGKPIHASKTKEGKAALFATGFAYDRKERTDHYLAIFREFMRLGHGVRRGGAAAVDLCYVAAGRVDGFWEEKLRPWDIAAGSLILKEAGGKVSMFDGSPLDLYGDNICASNGRIHEEMLCVLKPFFPNP